MHQQQSSPRQPGVVLHATPVGAAGRTASPSHERQGGSADAHGAHLSPRLEVPFQFNNCTPRGGPRSPTPGGGGLFGNSSHPGSFHRNVPQQQQRLSIAFTKSDENACSHCFGADTIIKSVRNAGQQFANFVADEEDLYGDFGQPNTIGGGGEDDTIDNYGHHQRGRHEANHHGPDDDEYDGGDGRCDTAVTSATRSYRSQASPTAVSASTLSGSNSGLLPPHQQQGHHQQQQPRPPPNRPVVGPRGLCVDTNDTPTVSPLDSPAIGAASTPHHHHRMGSSHRLPAIIPDVPGGHHHHQQLPTDCLSTATSNPTSLSDPPSLSVQEIRLGTPSSMTASAGVRHGVAHSGGRGARNSNSMSNVNCSVNSNSNGLENSFALSGSLYAGPSSSTSAEAMRRSLRHCTRERLVAFSMALFEQFQGLRNVVENRLVDPCTCGSVAMQEVVPAEQQDTPQLRPAASLSHAQQQQQQPSMQWHGASSSNPSPLHIAVAPLDTRRGNNDNHGGQPHHPAAFLSPRRPQDGGTTGAQANSTTPAMHLPPLATPHSPRKTSIDTVMSVGINDNTAASTAASSPTMPNAVAPSFHQQQPSALPQQQQRPVVTIVPRQRQRSQVAFAFDDNGAVAGATPQETPRCNAQQSAVLPPPHNDRRDSAASHNSAASANSDPSPHDGPELISFEPLPPDADEHNGPRAPLKARKSLIMSTTVAQETDDVSGFEMVNQYLMMEEIGSGASGIVFAVCNTESNKDFAMKVIKRDRFQQRRSSLAGTIQNGAPQMATNREVAIMKKLRHPNIVRLHEVIDDHTHNKLYLVMQLLTGGRLCPSLDMATGACEPVPADLLRRYVYQMCDGLRYLHQHNIIHRDVKPENMMLDEEGNVVLVDFGVSEVAADDACTVEGAIGTPAFMAPEVWDGDKVCGAAADVWSLGVSVFMMLVGRSPFPATTRTELIEQVRTRRPDFPPDMASEWRSLLKGTLTKDPATRISLSAIMRNKMFAEFRPVDASTSQRPNALRGAIVVTEDDVQSAIAGRTDFQVVFCDDVSGGNLAQQTSLIGQLEADSDGGPSPLSSTNVYGAGGGGAPPSGYSGGIPGAGFSLPGAGSSAPAGYFASAAGYSGTGAFSLPGAGLSGLSGPLSGISTGFVPSNAEHREPSLGERSGSNRSAPQQVLSPPPVVVCVSEEKLIRARSRRVVRSGGGAGSSRSAVAHNN